MTQFRYPNITGKTPEERQSQMERYVRSMVDQLNFALKDNKDNKVEETSQKSSTGGTVNVQGIVDGKLKKYWETIYPVGSLYFSVSETEPGTLFGGTWEQIEDRFLLASGSSYKAGTTGGEANHKLTESEMPSHTHPLYAYAWSWGNNIADAAHIPNNNVVGGTTSGNNIYTIQSKWNTTKSTGSGTAHNNMPPYLAVYVWKRIA